ncbi:MAG: dipeptidase [Armatimonadetes bacterium CG_4_10_14_3_um_filter_66_18]|nr:dipeptidase [Armatimonadota bacterium]OIP03596.1 MAG: dipeptidase [Armatimonadetes bacterium CG2_30_66_41]PIU90967.1 MAG: dipeptidase [Armatimonadetes bacterium CG06_land_8_20_14_3_00_66_21]PIX47948.1 MAG: dipeptidase [Armatimonadetes bacterium CG_4_8_14_3_um_filter_66_20]PIY42917.1 MAG: dipeptidase [Armatimonadetes bacterium CG_4_10_14_3_um_filter_66_18]PIZ46459.1 MAG: dipeptidase [Armatimonadetes bacterium CG_4_10_14_0_8_um_filter_66_14]PJB61028.1 MAG: dipeptidase [Armatimonadetes bacter
MNEKIRTAREAALAVLQPSPKDLEHGLELHADALVCESYGFAPRCAVDGDALRAAAEAGASDAELQDRQEDMTMTRCATVESERKEFVEAWEAAGVDCIMQNAGEEGQAPLRLLKRLARFTYVADRLPDFLRRAARPDDIVAAREDGRRCFYLTGNGVPLTQDWVSIEDELRYIRIFFQLGIRMMHLTYNRRNMIGDGCAEPANGGLSDFGRAVVAEMNRVGVIVDVAHSGWRTSLEAAQASARPMVASHAVCHALNPHCRSKPDEVLRAIVDTDGLVGICCIPAFLGGTGDLSALLDHIDHVAKTFGADHVAIGTDVAYTSTTASAEQKKVPSRGPARHRWENFWPPDDDLHKPQWRTERQVQSMAWTNWPMFTVGLVQRGYSDDDIRKILGGNVLRVARAVWPSA